MASASAAARTSFIGDGFLMVKAPPTRRRRGEPRRLLLESACALFSRQGFATTSTREIADHAGVSETLMFRYFRSKAGLFREALVVPFIEYVETLNEKWKSGELDTLSDEGFAGLLQLVGDLFDLFRENRGLVVMLWEQPTARTPRTSPRPGSSRSSASSRSSPSSARSRRYGVRATRSTATTSPTLLHAGDGRRHGGVRKGVLRHRSPSRQRDRRGAHAGPGNSRVQVPRALIATCVSSSATTGRCGRGARPTCRGA